MIVADALDEYLRTPRERRERPAGQVGGRFNVSGALACHRARCLDALGTEPSNPPPPQTLVAFSIGATYHTLVQLALAHHFGEDFEPEVRVDFRPDLDLTGYADGVIRSTLTVVEIKTMAPYAFGLAVEGDKRRGYATGPDGPKLEHLVQAGLYAQGLALGQVLLVYIDKGSGRTAEWLVRLGDVLSTGQTLRLEVASELAEIAELCDLLDRGKLPERYVPGFGPVGVLPATDSRDGPWQCRLCRHYDTCSAIGPVAVNAGMVQR
jgi:hypothetical protein